jgi:hypothetical protein
VITAITRIEATKSKLADTTVAPDACEEQSLGTQLSKFRRALRCTIAALDHRLIDTQSVLGLPASFEIEKGQSEQLTAPDVQEDEMISNAFLQMIQVMSQGTEPSNILRMKERTRGEPAYQNLHTALEEARWLI